MHIYMQGDAYRRRAARPMVMGDAPLMGDRGDDEGCKCLHLFFTIFSLGTSTASA